MFTYKRITIYAFWMLIVGWTAGNLANATTSPASHQTCEQLDVEFPSLLLWPNSTNYASESVRYWDIRSDLSPTCIFQAHEDTHVARLVQLSRANNAPFSVRGGGHMNYPGSNNIDGGVLMTLNAMDGRQISADRTNIAVGPGNRWVDVYKALEPLGLYAIGGRLKTIGVPGLTLIGGFHYFNNKYGFAMDNVLSYDVVLGNGSQITANETSHPDLFWALKGGANNFGTVTKFVLKTISAPLVSTTIQSYAEAEVSRFVKAVCDFAKADDNSIGAGGVFTVQYNVSTGSLTSSVLGVQEGTLSPPARFANFSAINSTTRIDNVTTPAQWASALDSPNQMFRVQFAHHTMRPDAHQLLKHILQWRNALKQLSDVEGLYPTFVLNVMPASAHSVAKTNGIGNIWGFENETQPYILFQLSTAWAHSSDDIRMTQWSKYLIEDMHRTNKDLSLASEFIYMGDAGEIQDPWAGFPTQNVERLKNISRLYDPDWVFQRLNYGGFKLGF